MNYTIGACGFGATGSSAVSDLLREFNRNCVIDSCEMTLAHEVDGLSDLKYQITEGSTKMHSSNTAMYRFLKACQRGAFRHVNRLTEGELLSYANEFVDAITMCEWIGNSPGNRFDSHFRNLAIRAIAKYQLGGIHNSLSRLLGEKHALFPMGPMRFTYYPSCFEEESKLLVRKVLLKLGADFNKNIVLDQPFPGNNPRMAFQFFDNPKAIVVDRDPRDYYLFCKLFLRNRNGWSATPTNTVENYVDFFRGMRQKAPYKEEDENVLVIHFEDLIYKYDSTVSMIMDFCDLKTHDRPKQEFNPSASRNNTQLFKSFKGYDRDVAYIEKQLPEYLFPFEEFDATGIDCSKMFFGNARRAPKPGE